MPGIIVCSVKRNGAMLSVKTKGELLGALDNDFVESFRICSVDGQIKSKPDYRSPWDAAWQREPRDDDLHRLNGTIRFVLQGQKLTAG